ncbi:chain length determinant protein [Treponema primitia ZAS-2]|uniref:Chain length determinant protein n=1 Tax=Treponema primitia (strain ATCC BAA-887 / DSM 12427 / ZAS-2) TaxID=545694 RepID=F5YN27_TREPZ|nr:Wzz/FepE/Etk N-terminal domain-containing protein [Treponema primitia]AEF85967.1 chain length determinant protein [Treponema primitia ZAS-2]
MNEEKNIDYSEISLIDLFAVLWHRKIIIIAITIIAIIGTVTFSIISIILPPETSPLPNQYTPTALMLINNSSSSNSGMASMLNSSGLGGLAGLAGVSTGSSFSDLAIYLVSTNSFLDAVVDEFGLIVRYKIEKFPRTESRKVLKKHLTASSEEKSGVFSFSFEDYDPVLAQKVVNFCMHYLESWFNELGIDKNKLERENLERNIENTFREIQNLEQESQKLGMSVTSGGAASIPSIALEQRRIALELGAQQQVYTQLKVQYELLKVTMASEKPVFQILEMAEIPDQKSGPGRGMICVIVTFAAGFFSVFLAFSLNAIDNVKKDPEAMAKLRGTHT